jgi:phosphoglycolate phosphatase-like HAD superfamily hydrolase
MAEAAVIFDVDGVLLHLTRAEEDAFFWPFQALHGLTKLSTNWNSYRVRNDVDIIAEVLENHFGRPPIAEEHQAIVSAYLDHLHEGLHAGRLAVHEISGARDLLHTLSENPMLIGTATANLREAARLRLEACGLWRYVAGRAYGADGGGHKREILARAIAQVPVAKSRIVYVGDNLTDLDAGRANGVHFIGFATDPERRERLHQDGAPIVCGDHRETLRHIGNLLSG